MKILSVLIEYGLNSLDREFSYLYEGEKRVEKGFRVRIPFGHQSIMGFVTRVEETNLSAEEWKQKNGYELLPIQGIVDQEPLLNEELLTLADEVASYYLSPRISVLQAMLPPSLRPSISSLSKPKIAYDTYVSVLDASEEGLTPKQIEMVRLVASNEEILKKEAGSPDILKRLVSMGRLRLFQKEKQRFQIPDYEREQPHDLNQEQQKAYDGILASSKEVILLQGVTGSGKTEVYLHLSEAYLQQGKSILMMVPEISLTPVMVEYFSRRFGKQIAILHSGLTPSEKYDEYRRIARGEAKIVVGARSAVFAPLTNIGLILIDEEHVESYKQDGLPFYHAREVAILRAKHFNAKVVLGSATPSFETKARAGKGVYGYEVMEHRANSKPLPKTQIIDLRDRSIMMPGDRVFSKILLDKIKDRLDKKEQVMLLVNRRGYASFCRCAHCGYTFTCPTCHGNLTYHKEDGMLKCHHCGYVELYPDTCPSCGGHNLQRVGFGTERAVKVLQEYLPDARIARLDSDIGKAKKTVEKTLRDFKNKEYDILIGTQMIAKGHDFPSVTLVGVLLADIGLMLPSYRASETTFELIAQAVGRSGRGSLQGEALIQTYNPQHYAITLGAKQDYEAFYRREMQERHMGHYPPFYFLACLTFYCKDENRAILSAENIRDLILAEKIPSLAAIGPMVPYFPCLGEWHRRNVLLQFRDPSKVKPFLGKLIHEYSGKGGVKIVCDVDPLDY